MSLTYLLDGYNIIKQVPELAVKKLEDGRDSLVRLIELYQPQGSANNPVIVVFDGRPGFWSETFQSGVKVIFSDIGSADDKIKELVEDSPGPKNVIVVTNDRDIKYAVRPLGAKVISVAEFWDKIQARAQRGVPLKPEPRSKAEEKHISKVMEFRINAEFEDIWVNKNKSKKTPKP